MISAQKAIMLELLLMQYRDSDDNEIQMALDYLRITKDVEKMFPYAQKKTLGEFECVYDNDTKLYYVVHQGKKLFFPKKWSKDRIEMAYRFAIEDDDIIGDGYRERSPHQYQSEKYHIREGDVLIDAGSAEGLLSLDMIDKVKRVYLVENDPDWWEPLQYTFAPYLDKVVVVKKFLSDIDNENSITLDTLLEKEETENVFIKMDIEGAEVVVLNKARKILSERECSTTLTVCTYHRETDFVAIRSLFDGIGYNSEVSDGYVLTNLNDRGGLYSFRHGIIRASNQKNKQ